MTDPVTIFTAYAIADFAFREFIKSGAGEVAKKFSAGAIAKMNELRKMIVHKLQGKNETLDLALKSAEKGDVTAIATVGEYLESAMQDEAFAQAVRSLAQQIQQALWESWL